MVQFSGWISYVIVIILSILAILGSNVWAQTNRASKQSEQITTTLNTLLNGYDKRVRPSHGGPPVDIGLSMYILRFDSIWAEKMEFTMTYYFRQTWVDPRLRFHTVPNSFPVIGDELSKRIWTPDTFTVNQKSQFVTDEITRLSSDGEVLRSVRMTTTASCPMSLQFFPMDRQVCTLELESFGSSMNDIKYYWARGSESIILSPTLALSQWSVVGYRGLANEFSLSTGNYSRVSVQINFARSVGHYVITVYLPASILVILSWIPLWLNGEALTGRVLTGVICMLSLLQLWLNLQFALPKISYVKAIDVYLVACIGLVFISMIEHAIITCLVKGRKNHRKNMQNDVSRNAPRKPYCHCLAPRLLDWFFRLALPTVFVIFNVVYWRIYLTASDVKDPYMIPFNEQQQ